jgi:hypothetical protein
MVRVDSVEDEFPESFVFPPDVPRNSVRPVAAHALVAGDYFCIGSIPCQLLTVTHSKAGKHGGSKIFLVATHVFTGTRHDVVVSGVTILAAPIFVVTRYTVIEVKALPQEAGAIAGDVLVSLVDDKGVVRDNVPLSGWDLNSTSDGETTVSMLRWCEWERFWLSPQAR